MRRFSWHYLTGCASVENTEDDYIPPVINKEITSETEDSAESEQSDNIPLYESGIEEAEPESDVAETIEPELEAETEITELETEIRPSGCIRLDYGGRVGRRSWLGYLLQCICLQCTAGDSD